MRPRQLSALLFLLVLCICQSAFAQSDTLAVASNSAKAKAVASRLKQDLALTEQQQLEVEKIALIRLNSFDRVRTNGRKLDSGSVKTVDADGQARLAKVLTTDQLKTYRALRENTRLQREAYKKHHPEYELSEEDLGLDL